MVGASLAATPEYGWRLLFARQPEPDLEFDDLGDDLDETPAGGSPQKKPKKSSSRKPIHWILFLLIASIGGLFAYDPEFAMEIFGLQSQAPPPPVVTPVPRPKPAAPTTAPPVADAPAASPGMAAAPGESPTSSVDAPAPADAGPAPVATASAIPVPMFHEGQRVVAITEPAQPNGPSPLSLDAAGSRPGPALAPGAVLTVLDGELRDNRWIYSVRTTDGATGWIPEHRLKPQP